MDPRHLTGQMVDLYKAMFASGLNIMSTIQDYTERTVYSSLEKSPWLPGDSRVLVEEWLKACRKGYDDFQTGAKEGLRAYEEAFAAPEKGEAEAVESTEKIKIKKRKTD